MNYIKLLIIFFFLFIFMGCLEKDEQKRDILIESVQNFEEVFNTPLYKGKKIFSKYCSVCHGTEGKGDGFNAYNLNPKPRNFIDSSFVAKLDTALLIETITNGGKAAGLSPKMPPWGKTLTEDDIIYVTNYIISITRY